MGSHAHARQASDRAAADPETRAGIFQATLICRGHYWSWSRRPINRSQRFCAAYKQEAQKTRSGKDLNHSDRHETETETLHLDATSRKRKHSVYHDTNESKKLYSFHPDFPSRVRCFEQSLFCTKVVGQKICDNCKPLGIAMCMKREQLFGQGSITKNTRPAAKTPR